MKGMWVHEALAGMYSGINLKISLLFRSSNLWSST